MIKISRPADDALKTAAEWRYYTRAHNSRTNSWVWGARHYAATHGVANVLKADDTLVIFYLGDGGKVRRQTFKPRTWCWA